MNTYTHAETISAPPSGSLERVPDTGGAGGFKMIKVTPLTDAGNVRAVVEIETPNGETITGRIVKQENFRAYLVPPEGITFTHKEKRIIQREAVTAWADQIGDTLPGLLESEKVFRCSRFHRLGVQIKVFCPACDLNTPSEFSEIKCGAIRNACLFCGTLRKGRPYISRAEAERIKEISNACEGTRKIHEAEAL